MNTKKLVTGSFLGEVLRGAGGTGLSRVTGLVRDAAIAYAFGASASYDAFLVALFIPQALRQLLGEGGLAAAFVPVYAKSQEKREAAEFARSALTFLLLGLPFLCAGGVFLARWYVPLLAAGFSPEKMATSVALAGWLFPLIGFVSVAALAGGILNAHGKFFLPALAPAVLNLGMVAGALGLSGLFPMPIFGLAAGSLLGGLGMVLLVFPPALRAIRGRSRLWPPHPALKEVGWRLLPSLGAVMVAEANVLVDNRLASYLPHGSIAVLQYAMRLFQFPLGVLAVSVASAALPRLSRHVAQGEEEEFRGALARGVLVTTALVLPATVGLLILGEPIVAILFQRGEFSAADTARTYHALVGYLVGLWGYALVYLFSRAQFALGKPGLPLLAGAAALGVNVGLNLWWVRIWGTFGLALATGVAGWVDALLLGRALWGRDRGWLQFTPLLKVAVAVAAMAGGLLPLRQFLAPCGPWVQVAVGVPLGIALYAGVALALGITRSLQAGR